MRRLVFLLLLLPVLAQDDEELPPGPLKDLADALKRGDKEIRLDLHQSELNAIEHWLVKDRERGIRELSGEYLSEYRTERVEVDMVAEERAEYEAARTAFTDFLESKNLKLGTALFQDLLISVLQI